MGWRRAGRRAKVVGQQPGGDGKRLEVAGEHLQLAQRPGIQERNGAQLADVANKEKFMPRDFITADGFGITEKCKRYLRPLIVGEDPPKFRDGMPVYATLKNVPVARKLPAFELK